MATRHLQKHFWLILCLPPCSHTHRHTHTTHTPHTTPPRPNTNTNTTHNSHTTHATCTHNTTHHHTHHTTHQTTDRDLESFFMNARICAHQSTDRDLESVFVKRSECLEMCTAGNRPWSRECLQRECLDMCLSDNRPWSWDEKVNAWIRANVFLFITVTTVTPVMSVIFLRIYCFRFNIKL